MFYEIPSKTSATINLVRRTDPLRTRAFPGQEYFWDCGCRCAIGVSVTAVVLFETHSSSGRVATVSTSAEMFSNEVLRILPQVKAIQMKEEEMFALAHILMSYPELP
jgi:hypothetical protein